MDKNLAKRYQELTEGLKELFKELAASHDENERLSRENIALREEVSLLRLYIDSYMQAGEDEDVSDLAGLDLSRPTGVPEEAEDKPNISEEALAFYESLPGSFNFSELFELADLLGIEKHKMKGYMTIYLRENMMKQQGTRVEKTARHHSPWKRTMGRNE